MRENMREHLNTEISRKQFLQYMAGAFLMVFGLNNLVALLTGTKFDHHTLPGQSGTDRRGFGSSRFGV